MDELLPHFLHRGPLEFVGQVPAFGAVQAETRTAAKLDGTLCGDVDKEKPAVDPQLVHGLIVAGRWGHPWGGEFFFHYT